MNNQIFLAKITGFSLILMAVIAGFSFGYAFPKFFDISHLELAKTNIAENKELYKLMLLGIILIVLLDLLVSWTLYQYFKYVNYNLALFSLILRIIYTILFCIATYFLTINLVKSSNEIVIENYQSFDKIWSFGLIIFGTHILIVGQLMKLHQTIHRTLWWLTFIAGFSYILVHSIKIIFPALTDVAETLNTLLALPMALGELGLAVWLIVKGKENNLKVKTPNLIKIK